MEYRFYRSLSGRSPVEEFLEGLGDKQAAKAVWTFRLLQEHERIDLAKTRYFKKLEASDGTWEIRVAFGGDIFRFLGFFDREVFIINHAFMKKDQKTRKQDIELSKLRMYEYLFRRRSKELS